MSPKGWQVICFMLCLEKFHQLPSFMLPRCCSMSFTNSSDLRWSTAVIPLQTFRTKRHFFPSLLRSRKTPSRCRETQIGVLLSQKTVLCWESHGPWCSILYMTPKSDRCSMLQAAYFRAAARSCSYQPAMSTSPSHVATLSWLRLAALDGTEGAAGAACSV